MDDLNDRLRDWCDQDELPDDVGDRLFVELLALPDDRWHGVDPTCALELIEFASAQRTPSERIRLLNAVRGLLVVPSRLARWRALRVLEPDAPRQVWEELWADALSDDETISSNAVAVLEPALRRRDPTFLNELEEQFRRLPFDSPLRKRLAL